MATVEEGETGEERRLCDVGDRTYIFPPQWWSTSLQNPYPISNLNLNVRDDDGKRH
jgi:hypothetical protein